MVYEFLRELLRFVILVLIRPVLKAIVAIASPIYKMFFGWFDARTHITLQERLEHDIRQDLPWLFEKYKAKVIPNVRNYPHAFDYAVVTVAAEHLLFAFIRGRGELRVEVAPERFPNNWQEIGEIIASIAGLKDSVRYYHFQDLGRLLEQNLGQLRDALTKAG